MTAENNFLPSSPGNGANTMKSRHWFEIPRGDTAFRHAVFALLFGILFSIAYGGASALSGAMPYRVSVDLAFEANIPYVPFSALVYVSLNVMLLMAPFLLHRWQQMSVLFFMLMVETFIAVLFFIFIPVEATPTIEQDPGVFASVYSLAELLNMERNEFPSLHVAFTITAALVYRLAHGAVAGRVFGLWAIAIVISTVLMKEHYVLDVVGGVVLACGTWHFGRRSLSSAKWLSRVDVELIALREMLTFSLRHRRYATIMVSIYVASAFGWRKRRILRTGFSCLQWIDDLLDHDRIATSPPLATAHQAIEQISGAPASNSRLSRLITAVCEDLGDEGRSKLIELIHLMCEDNKRMVQKQSMTAEKLKAHLDQTFILSFDLYMYATNSQLRSIEFPELIHALSWCSMERDLEDDLDCGLINIPSEIIQEATFSNPGELLELPHIQQWRRTQREEIIPVLDTLDSVLRNDERSGISLLKLFSRSIRKYALKNQ